MRGTSAEHATRVPIAGPAQSVGEARAALAGQEYECAEDLAVLDGAALVGVVPIERLLGAPEEARIADVMDADRPSLRRAKTRRWRPGRW